jgi:Chaperone of endosialidase
LDIAFAGGDGTITGVTTASGSGLTGGGTSGTLNLSLTNACAANQVLQWNGTAWTCAAVGTGTITGVTAGTDLTGGGTSGNVTLNLNTAATNAIYAQLAAANTFTGNQTVSGNLSATGVVTGSSYQIGSNLFAFGSYAAQNAFLGFAGNSTTTGTDNTASGYDALVSNTTGASNTAVGGNALKSNTTGMVNTAVGADALLETTTGGDNTAVGYQALSYTTTGGYNVGLGFFSGITDDSSALTGTYNTVLGDHASFSTGSLTNATAIGAFAEVSESNAIVLGQINGVGGGTANTNVGIGTTTPQATLDVAGSGLDTYIGNPGCSSGAFAGIAFGTSGFASGCTNYALVGDNSGNTYLASPTGAIIFRISNNATTAMKITSAGLVGIGTTSPDDTLSVNGNADKPGGGSWGTFSDARLKTLNGNFNAGLSQVLKIRPVRYRYKPDNEMGIHDAEEHIGVVAQEVQQIIPEAVTENSKGYLLVNNDPVIWAMVNAIKEQQSQIERQQSLLRAQAAAVRSLKAEVRETREALRKVKAQVAAAQLTVVAEK